MKIVTRIVAILCMVIAPFYAARGQVGTYTFASLTSTYVPITGGTTLLSGPVIFTGGYTVTLPFSFVFDAIFYNSIDVSTNGYITLGGTGGAGNPISTTGSSRAISAFGFDLAGGNSLTRLATDVSGAVPNRVVTIEWRNYDISYGGAALNFQIKLYESTHVIEMVYGAMSTTVVNPLAEVGIRGSSNTVYQNRSGYSSWVGTTSGGSSSSTVRLAAGAIPPVGLVYRWTPLPLCTAPAAQPSALTISPVVTTVSGSFTGVSGADKYLVVRSADAPLTAMPEDGILYATGDALGGGTVVGYVTGTSFSHSGLSPNTAYRYTIFSCKTGGCTGIAYRTIAPLTGTFTTFGPKKYTWVPASGSASYITAANWIPARISPQPMDTMVFNNAGTVTVTDVPLQDLSGLVISNNTQVTMTSNVTDSLRLQKFFDLASGSSLTLGGTNTLKIAFTSGSGNWGTIAGTLKLNDNSGYNATNSVTSITGTVDVSGSGAALTTYCSCNTSIMLDAGGTYVHGRNGGNIPQATYSPTSLVQITGVTSTAPVFHSSNTEIGSLTWNCTGQTSRMNLSTPLVLDGTFTVGSTGSDTLVYTGSGLTVGKDFIQTGGRYRIATNTTAKLKVLGDISLSGGYLDLNSLNSTTGNYTNFLVYRHYTQGVAHSIIKSGTTGSAIAFLW